MGNYNFEKDNKDFGETIRIEDINKEVQKHETDEMQNIDKDFEDTIPGTGSNKPKTKKDNDLLGKIYTDKKFLILGALIAIILIVVITVATTLFFVNSSNENLPKDTIENAEDVFESQSSDENYVIKAFKDNTVYLYGLESKKIYSAETDKDTIITGINGGNIEFDKLALGDVVTVIKNEETGTAQQIRWAEGAWKIEGQEDVRVDSNSSTISLMEAIYRYDENTMFIYDGKEILDTEISYADIVDITGIDNNVICVTVAKKHGYIYLKNSEEIDNLKIRIDFGDEIGIEENMVVVPEGKHTVIITGANIEDYMTEVTVEENSSVEIDLSEAKPKLTKVHIHVSPGGKYSLKIDDEQYPEGTKLLELEGGKYVLEINKEGYEPYIGEIEVGEEDVNVDIKLDKIIENTNPPSQEKPDSDEKYGNVTIYSDPGWANVYVDGEYKGVTPIMVKLSYGEHYILLTLDGYEDCGEHITVNSAESTYKGSLK